jgi:hypothetical protein
VDLEVRHFDLLHESLPWNGVDGEGDDEEGGDGEGGASGVRPVVVVANLLRPLLLELAATMPSAPPNLLASGLLVGEVDEIVAAFGARLGMRERERRQRGEWAAVWLVAG